MKTIPGLNTLASCALLALLALPAALISSESLAFYHAQGATEKKAVTDGSVTIKSPEEGETVKGTDVEVVFDFEKGGKGDHVHIFLDGELLGPVYGKKYVLDELKKGEHTIEVKLATKSHVLLGPEARVKINVQ